MDNRLNSPDSPETYRKVHFYFLKRELIGYEGEPIAAALLANGIRTIRIDEATGQPRGIYCGIGHCYECRAVVDGVSGVRTCLTPLREGITISSTSDLSKDECKNES